MIGSCCYPNPDAACIRRGMRRRAFSVLPGVMPDLYRSRQRCAEYMMHKEEEHA